jgi:hypothetical protein
MVWGIPTKGSGNPLPVLSLPEICFASVSGFASLSGFACQPGLTCQPGLSGRFSGGLIVGLVNAACFLAGSILWFRQYRNMKLEGVQHDSALPACKITASDFLHAARRDVSSVY